jgi:hypothetical protein
MPTTGQANVGKVPASEGDNEVKHNFNAAHKIICDGKSS